MLDLKSRVKLIARNFGYEVRKIRCGPTRHSIAESYCLLSGLGLRPKTVIDVGVAEGTFEMYSAFPDSYLLLIEPLQEYVKNIESILDRYHGSYVLAAAGSEAKPMTINVHSAHLPGSSIYKESMGAAADGYERTVDMITVDQVVAEKNLSEPFLIKVDVQGAELDVLDGCEKVLGGTEAVALEVSMFEFMKGAPQFYDVVVYMKDRGFVAYDIVPGLNRPLDNALAQVDIIFVRDDGIFRVDHSFSTVDQMTEIFGSQ